MYIAGLEKILKAGQELGLTGQDLRDYFDAESAKLKADLALNREARRLGVDTALLKQASGGNKEAILREYQQKKDEERREALREYEKRKVAEEREIAALKLQVKVLESRLRAVHPNGIPEQMTGFKTSRMSYTLCFPPSEPESNRSQLQNTVLGLQGSQQNGKDSSGVKQRLPNQEANGLPLACKTGNCDVVFKEPELYKENLKGPQAEESQCSPTVRTYPINETLIIAAGPPTVTELLQSSKKLSRKREHRKKTVITLTRKTSVRGSLYSEAQPRVGRWLLSHRSHWCLKSLRPKRDRQDMLNPEQKLGCLVLQANVRLHKPYINTFSTIDISAGKARVYMKTCVKKSRKRYKRRERRQRKDQKRNKHCVFNFQGRHCLLSCLTIRSERCCSRRRTRYRGFFHSRGACCPKRKRRRLIS